LTALPNSASNAAKPAIKAGQEETPPMDRPRAADDFDTIRQRLDELRREREVAEAVSTEAGSRAVAIDAKAERRRRDRLEGSPPPWAPTIFTKPPRR
jgi:hypothetical protein